MGLRMKVMHWNYFNETDGPSGIKRYESELYDHLQEFTGIQSQRVQRHNRNIFFDDFKERDADIVHATFQGLTPLVLVKKPRCFILTVHDLIPKFYYSIPQKIKHMWYLIEASINKADIIIVDSQYTKHDLICMLGIPKDQIVVIPLGVSRDFCEYNKRNSRKRFGFKEDKMYILINSSNESWKNIGTLNRIIDLSPDYIFVKIGYGSSIERENVINLGYVSDFEMPYLYSACDVFLHTSEYEGFGLPVLEAMACGCPVVCSNATSLPEVVENGGILVNTMDVVAYCDAIDTILSSQHMYEKIKDAGFSQAAKFTWNKTVELTMEVYHKCWNGY